MQLAVIGNPIAHSLSPLLHNAAFRALEINGYYGRYLLQNKESFSKVANLGLLGANITVPFKEVAYNHCDEVYGIAKEVGSVNTLVFSCNQLLGYNTDAWGFYRCLQVFNPKSALIIGAGGSSKALAEILRKNSIIPTITNRTQEKLEYFKNLGFNTASFEELKDKNTFDSIINATPAGLVNSDYPLPKEILENLIKNTQVVFDLIYGRNTPFLTLGLEHKKIVLDGEEMLINQAAFAFEIFMKAREITIDREEVIGIMSKILKTYNLQNNLTRI